MLTTESDSVSRNISSDDTLVLLGTESADTVLAIEIRCIAQKTMCRGCQACDLKRSRLPLRRGRTLRGRKREYCLLLRRDPTSFAHSP